jgi:hypothetical protein
VTHEYIIATGGAIDQGPDGADAPRASAIAWAFSRILAVGADEDVRALSRGDSTFLDIDGCEVTALPADPPAAEAAVATIMIAGGGGSVGEVLRRAGLLGPDDLPELGAPADLAFWDARPATGRRLVAVVRAGAFTEGDKQRGSFAPPAALSEGAAEGA